MSVLENPPMIDQVMIVVVNAGSVLNMGPMGYTVPCCRDVIVCSFL